MAATIVQYLGTGRRKRAVARVILRPGKGEIKVNGRTFENYFPTENVRAVVRQRDHHLAPGGRHQHGVGDRRVRRQGANVEAELVEQAEGAGGEAVAAGLVAREGRLVDDQRVEPQTVGFDPGGDPGGARTHDEDVHPPDGTHVSPWRPDRGKNQVIRRRDRFVGAPGRGETE